MKHLQAAAVITTLVSAQIAAFGSCVIKIPSQYEEDAPYVGAQGGCATFVACPSSEGCVNTSALARLQCTPLIVIATCEILTGGVLGPNGYCIGGTGATPPIPHPAGKTVPRVTYTMSGFCLNPIEPGV